MKHKRLHLKLIAALAILIAITGCTADSQVRLTPIAGWCDDSAGIIIPEDVRCYFENAAPPSSSSEDCEPLSIIERWLRPFPEPDNETGQRCDS